MQTMQRCIFFGFWLLTSYTVDVSGQATETCTTQINSCACKTPGGFINLDPLDQAKSNGQPKWTNQPDATYPDTSYSYNPCTAFTVGTDGGCVNVAGCQTQYSVNYAIGTQDSAKFSTDTSLGTILTYTTTDGRTLKVQLICDKNQEGALSNVGEALPNPGTYDITLTTKYACSDIGPPPPGYGGGSLSPGSIMLIIFFVLITVYLVVGVLFNKFYRGTTGKELIPHVDFWTELPGLARDGVLFTFNKAKGLTGKRSSEVKSEIQHIEIPKHHVERY